MNVISLKRLNREGESPLLNRKVFMNHVTSWPPDSPESTGPPAAAAPSGEQEPGDLQPGVRRDDGESPAVRAEAEPEEEANLTSTPDKAPCGLAPLQLTQLRTKNTDSFDMEEVGVGLSPPSCLLSSAICSTHALLRPLGSVNSFFSLSHNHVSFSPTLRHF